MTPNNVLSRSHHTLSILVFLLALLASVGTATAGELGEVGVIHPDGRVELDFDRFTSTIQVEDGNTVGVSKVLIKISNGFLYIVRLGDDGCTTEVLTTTGGYTVNDHFPLIRSNRPDGLYAADGSMELVDPTPVPKTVAVIDITSLVQCENVSCNGGLCARNEWGSSIDCDCVYFEVVNGVLERDPGNPGCEKRLVFPHWWTLSSTVEPAYIQSF